MTTPVYRRQPVLVMETGINQVVGGAQAGWVSGNPAGLADGASASVVFDLGPEWDQYVLIQLAFLSVTATNLSSVSVGGSDTPAYNSTRRIKEAATPTSSVTVSTSFHTVTTAGSTQSGLYRPFGRYVCVQMTNTAGAGAQGAGAKVSLAAYPA